MKIGIIGAGVTGLTAGYELVKKGQQVVIFEQEKEYGGLVGTFDVGEAKLEKFYHHIFTSDSFVTELAGELGLTSSVRWKAPHNAIFINGKLYPFTSPADLLLFKELPFLRRISLGLLIYQARLIKNWDKLEHINAKDWVMKKAGKCVYDKVWGPLLSSKFGTDAEKVSAAWLWNKFKLRGSTRGKNISQELLGYVEGSFGRIYGKLTEKIEGAGGKIILDTQVTKIEPQKDKTLLVNYKGGREKFHKVIVTAAPEIFSELAELPLNYKEALRKIKYKTNICMVMELSQQLSPYYWITVAERDFPFVAVIELFSAPDSYIKDLFLENLKKMFPSLQDSCIKKVHVNRARYAQPVMVTEYSKIKPEYKTPVENLYLATMAQIYPEDRGQNYAIREGKEIANIVLQEN